MGFSPRFRESRWIWRRVTIPIVRITQFSRMCYIGPLHANPAGMGPLPRQRRRRAAPRRVVSHRRTIVVRTGLLRPTLGGREGEEVTTTYAVCPHCQERQDFTGKPDQLKCLRCAKESKVDWSETC